MLDTLFGASEEKEISLNPFYLDLLDYICK